MFKAINQRISLFLFLLAAGYLILSYQLPSYPYTSVDADVIPKGLGWILLVLSIFLFFSKDTETTEQKERRNIPKKELAVLASVFAFIFLYIWLLEMIGFVIVTALFIYFTSWFLGYKRYVSNVMVSVLFPIVMYVIFTFLLKINLPQGIMPF